MANRPEGETRKERRRQWIVGVAVVIALLSLLGNVVLGLTNYQKQQAYNVSTANRQREIIGLIGAVRTEQSHQATRDKELVALQEEVAGIIERLPAAVAADTAFTRQILAVDQFAITCLTTKNCSNPPVISLLAALPQTSSSSPPPATTTTTVPPRGKGHANTPHARGHP